MFYEPAVNTRTVKISILVKIKSTDCMLRTKCNAFIMKVKLQYRSLYEHNWALLFIRDNLQIRFVNLHCRLLFQVKGGKVRSRQTTTTRPKSERSQSKKR
jgi:hypothetical protein